ncbi:hypothetical protein MPSEU_000198600 [Mayamaea pseudoterrestris]|nr:hypothetical protein MPSEU_000198600 [Mayamaea pseudoterrestris]
MMPVTMMNLPKFDHDFVRIQPAKNSPSEAARLLLKVKEIAIKEFESFVIDVKENKTKIEAYKDEDIYCPRSPVSIVQEGERSKPRFANVSSPIPTRHSTTYHLVTPPLAPTKHKLLPEPLEGDYDVMSISSFVESDDDDDMPMDKLATTPRASQRNETTSKHKTQAETILRPKFSWKTYPELESYLVEHRSKYLQFSSQRNYTRDQKRYNNKLTQGLLALASESGYVFEGFTFAAIRDRIRCYYKSYVQACKKKKRVRRKHRS